MIYREVDDNPATYQILSQNGEVLACVYSKEQAVKLCEEYRILKYKSDAIESALNVTENNGCQYLEIKLPVKDVRKILPA